MAADGESAAGQRLYPPLPCVSGILSVSSGEEDDDYEEERDPKLDYFRGSQAKKSSLSGGLEQQGSASLRKHMGVDCQHWKVLLAVVCVVLGALCAVQQGVGRDNFLTCPDTPCIETADFPFTLNVLEDVKKLLQRNSAFFTCPQPKDMPCIKTADFPFTLNVLEDVKKLLQRKSAFFTCPQPKDMPCIETADLPLILNVLEHVKKMLQRKSAELGCMAQSNITVEEMNKSLKEQSNISLTILEMNRFIRLVIFNPHWGISLMTGDGQTITNWTASSNVLADVNSTKGAWCWAWLTLLSLWNYLQSLLIVLLLIVIVVVSVKWYIHHQHEELQSVFILVDKILEVLREHRKKCQQDKDLLPYVAIIHVRDMLIVPSERRRKHKLWEKAVQWVAAHESRVRVETRRIAGEDFTVWRWIQPPTEESHQSSRGPSPCMRLNNMFKPDKNMEERQVKELTDAVSELCCPHGYVHVYVDKRSGCIYLKMVSTKAAIAAYNQLHGSIFKGRLVNAKYIPEHKYYKWFPHAAKTPLSGNS